MFHPVKGHNIVLDETLSKASWFPIRTGGCFFSETPLKPDHTVSLLLDGTGGIEIGVIQDDPKTFVDNVPIIATDIIEYQTVTEVKLHRRSCRISIVLDTSKSEVISIFEGEQYTQTIDRNKDYWLALDVKYGEVDVKVEKTKNTNERYDDEMKFSHIHGPNIKIWNDKSTVKSTEKSPAALCFYDRPIKGGMKIILNCLPCPFHGTVPGRYYMKMIVYTTSPDELKDKVPSKFDISEQDTEQCKETLIHLFSKEDCTGEMSINILDDKLVVIDTAGTHVELTLNNISATDHWLGFELYGISVEIKAQYELAHKQRAIDRQCMVTNFQNNPHLQVKGSPNSNTTQEVNMSDIHRTQNSPTVDQYDLEANTETDVKDRVNLRASIQSNFVFLVNNFEIPDCLDYFVQAGLTDIDELNRLLQMYESDRKNARRQVLSVLSKRPISKKLFIEMLEHSNQMHLKEKFFCEESKD